MNKSKPTKRWEWTFSQSDIDEIKKYLAIMEPVQSLFEKLNGDTFSTMHMVLPSLKVG
jgi:hypothetical protein